MKTIDISTPLHQNIWTKKFTGWQILTAAAPKEVKEVESWLAQSEYRHIYREYERTEWNLLISD